MIRVKEDIRNIYLDSILFILISFFGLAIFQNAGYNKTTPNCKPVPVEISVLQSNAILSTGIQLHYFQKCWISNKDNFRLLTFFQTQYLVTHSTPPVASPGNAAIRALKRGTIWMGGGQDGRVPRSSLP